MKRLVGTILASLMLAPATLTFAEDPGARSKAISDAGKADSEADRIDMLAPYEAEKLEAETAKLYAEAEKLLSEVGTNDARREQIYTEIVRLRQLMRITDYEFQRIVSADYEMESEMNTIRANMNLVRPLVIGRANWKTWVALDSMMMTTVDADIIIQTMFDVAVPALAADQFIATFGGNRPAAFPGGSLGDLYTFVRENDYGFRPYSDAHKFAMRVLQMLSTASELRIQELRDINQSIRLTIARLS